MKKLEIEKGFSILEVIIAAAIFITFASGSIVAIISAFNSNRLGSEVTIANQFTVEGLEAVRSIKNQSWSTFSSKADTGNTGVGLSGGVWTFFGTSNTLPADSRFIRTISITSVQRDGSGNIVSNGGTNDSNTKKVTATTSWNFNTARPESVTFTDYLTYWKSIVGDGIAVYGESTSVAQPKYRMYDNSTNGFSAQAATGTSFTDAVVGKTFKVKTSPFKHEAIAGYVNNSGVLRVLCFDGTNWTSEWTATVGGNGTNSQPFDIAYAKTSGDVLVVYGTNASGSNEMAYRKKLGTTGCGTANWSAGTNISTVRTTGVVDWIRMESSPVSGSNTIGVAWDDANGALSAMEWTGSSFAVAEPTSAFETNLEFVAARTDVPVFDVVFESLTGNFMVVWSTASACGAGTCIFYSRYTSSWSAKAGIPTIATFGTNIDISANPASNEIVMAAIDNSSNTIGVGYWSGSAWTATNAIDTTTSSPVAGSQYLATGWLIAGATTRSIVVYDDAASTNVGWIVGNGSTFTVQTDFTPAPLFTAPQGWYQIEMDPKNKDRLTFILSDSGSKLYGERLIMTSVPGFTWTNSDGGAVLEASLGQATTAPFGFAYWKN